MKYQKQHINMGGLAGIPEYDIYITDENKIQKIALLIQTAGE